MKRIFLILCFLPLLCNSPIFAQIDFSRYVDENALPLLELGDPLKVDFKWTMYEKAVEVNPGLVQAYYNLGGLSLMKGDVKKGLRYFERR